MLIKAKFGNCVKCKIKFKTDEEIEWTREGGGFHIHCANAYPSMLEILDANVLADKLGFDDLPGRNKRGYIP